MNRKKGIHFYINIVNLDDVVEKEEEHTGEVRHAIHALDTFFSSIEAYGKRHYPKAFVIEKITGSRLHMYIESENIPFAFEIVSAVSQYAYNLTAFLSDQVGKYKTLLPFQLQVGACFGSFYEFEFERENANELTTIGFAANFAAKLQGLARPMHICMSQNIFDDLTPVQKTAFIRIQTTAIQKYDQDCYYDALLRELEVNFHLQEDLEYARQIAARVNLGEMQFRDATQQISYRALSKKEGKKLMGIPLFADIRGFTAQFDSEDANLVEMAAKTQNILTAMYNVVEKQHGTHVQFQGDRELAVFHDHSSYRCTADAVIAGLRIIDNVKIYQVSVGVGQAYGKLFAAKIGARGEKDNILLGRSVVEADRNEDEFADKNQLVISPDVYQRLQVENSNLAAMFQKRNGYYYTTSGSGYQSFLTEQSKKQLVTENRRNNYNGAWGTCGCK